MKITETQNVLKSDLKENNNLQLFYLKTLPRIIIIIFYYRCYSRPSIKLNNKTIKLIYTKQNMFTVLFDYR